MHYTEIQIRVEIWMHVRKVLNPTMCISEELPLDPYLGLCSYILTTN